MNWGFPESVDRSMSSVSKFDSCRTIFKETITIYYLLIPQKRDRNCLSPSLIYFTNTRCIVEYVNEETSTSRRSNFNKLLLNASMNLNEKKKKKKKRKKRTISRAIKLQRFVMSLSIEQPIWRNRKERKSKYRGSRRLQETKHEECDRKM